jgi:hypothetical protein
MVEDGGSTVGSFSEEFFNYKGSSQALGNYLKWFTVARRTGGGAHRREAVVVGSELEVTRGRP